MRANNPAHAFVDFRACCIGHAAVELALNFCDRLHRRRVDLPICFGWRSQPFRRPRSRQPLAVAFKPGFPTSLLPSEHGVLRIRLRIDATSENFTSSARYCRGRQILGTPPPSSVIVPRIRVPS